MNKKAMTQAKAVFIILNLVFAIIAFSFLISGEDLNSIMLPDKTIVNGHGVKGGTTFISADNQKYNWVGSSDKGHWELVKQSGATGGGILGFLGANAMNNLVTLGFMTGIGYLIGEYALDGNGAALAASLGAGTLTTQILSGSYGTSGLFGGMGNALGANVGTTLNTLALPIGIGVGAVVFVLMYKKTSEKVIEITCLPWQAPIGGEDCEKCNEGDLPCSEYRCRSLGQACKLVNVGTKNQKCINANPDDVTTPGISPLIDENKSIPTKGYKYTDVRNRPPGDGSEPGRMRIVRIKGDNKCIKAFTPLRFGINTTEPAQCRIDYNHTKSYKEMNYYMGGSNIYDYEHIETLSLPGPDAMNRAANKSGVVLHNDGTYTFYIRCRDANGNANVDEFTVRLCVDKGPDTTPPKIVGFNIPSGSPIKFNTTSLNLEMYVNEPSDCRWSREDRDYDQMENQMNCANKLWEMNAQMVYTCKTTLHGIEDRKKNKFYFRCRDQPDSNSGRNTNQESTEYIVIGTQPLNILKVEPKNKTIYGSTDKIPVYIKAKTDNGYKNGESICYYSTTGDESDYIAFAENNGTEHSQRQDLFSGNYTYYIKCVDLGGNADYKNITFNIKSDRTAPIVVRAYEEGGKLKIITNEKSTCSYSFQNCNFDIKDGIQMPNSKQESHTADWKPKKEYYIRCEDIYQNQPNPTECSIILKSLDLLKSKEEGLSIHSSG